MIFNFAIFKFKLVVTKDVDCGSSHISGERGVTIPFVNGFCSRTSFNNICFCCCLHRSSGEREWIHGSQSI